MVVISVLSNNTIKSEYVQSPVYTKNNNGLKLNVLDKDTVSFTGKPTGISLYNKLLRDISSTADDAVCTLEEAVEEFTQVDLPNKVKADYILSCVYKGTKHDMVINKKAILMLKKQILDIQSMPDLIECVTKCMDSHSKTFNSKRFKDLFDVRKQLNVHDISPIHEGANFRYVEMDRRNKILKALTETQFKNFETSDLFVSISSMGNGIISELNRVQQKSGFLPASLYERMVNAIGQNNFNLRKVYSEYYSKLGTCRTLEDVEKLYPELKFKKTKPVYDKNIDKNSMYNMLAKCTGYEYEQLILDALRQGYVDLIPQNSIKVKLPNHKIKSLITMKLAGFDIMTPPDELLEILNHGEEIINKYKDMPDLDSETLRKLAENHAIRKSKYWADYKAMTNNDIWMPVRFIRDKYSHPNTTEYTTDKLIDEYIASAYLKGYRIDRANPLELYNSANSLTTELIDIIDGMYMPVFRKQLSRTKVDKKTFDTLSARIDRVAMGKTIRNMENIFRKSFMSMYHSGPRKENYERELRIARNMISEKIKFKQQLEQGASQPETPPKKETWIQTELLFDKE